MKKMLFGALLTVIGLVFSAFSFIWAAANPWNYNGIDGLLGSFLGTGMLAPFIISFLLMTGGLVIVWYETYIRK